MNLVAAACRSCGAPILWCRSTGDRNMPIDGEPHPDGNIQVIDTERVPRAVVLGPLEVAAHRNAGTPLYRSHFASCPQAHEHRKPRTR